MATTSAVMSQWLASPSLSSWLSVAVAVLSPFLLTYLYTSIQYIRVAYGRADSSPAPTPPYFVPVVGHTIPFALNTDRYLRSLRRKFGKTPIRILVGPDVFTMIPHGETIQTLFKAKDLNNKHMALKSIGEVFGYPDEYLQKLAADQSGILPTPQPGFEDMPPEQRLWHPMVQAMHSLLQGTSLSIMLSHFIEKYTARVETKDIGFDDWVVVDDLYGMMKNDLFHAAMQALCGDHLFEVVPSMAEDFWAFDACLPGIFKKVPKWLSPHHYKMRQKVVDDIKKYQAWANEHFDWNDEKLVESSWEPIFGAKLMRNRQSMFRKWGHTTDADATLELGLIWATNSNAIPTAFWTLLGVLKSDNLKARVKAEVDECFEGQTVLAAAEKLTAGKLSQAMYHESLRYAVATMTARAPNHDGFRLGKWLLNKKDVIIASTWGGQRDETFWNAGRLLPDGTYEHPVDSWWAERFLQYPDDPASGPVRKPDPEIYLKAKVAKKTPEDDKKATVVTTGTAGHLFPYGGGVKICPGRFFAKNEMIAGAALLLRMFEIELVDPVSASKVGPDMNYFPFGALPPDRKVAARLRRRRL